MNEQLYIGANHQLVDMDDKTNITLKYKSNIFTDIGKIVSNNSYTIKLPNTVRNQSVFLHADLPACRYPLSSFMLGARYIRNGVEILKKAQAYLLKTSDSFEIALIWGNATHFAELASGKKKLNQLRDRYQVVPNSDYFDDYHISWTSWINGYKYDNKADFFVPRLELNLRKSDTEVTGHPAVRVKWILERIAADNNLAFTFPAKQQALLDRLFVPLLTRVDSKHTSERLALALTPSHYVNKDPVELYFTDKSWSTYYGEAVHKSMQSGTFLGGVITKGKSTRAVLSGKVVINANYSQYPNEASLNVSYLDAAHNNERVDIASIAYSTIKENGGNSYTITFDFEGVESDTVPAKTELSFNLTGLGNVVSIGSGDMNMRFEGYPISPKAPVDNVNSGNGHYPIIPNLPDMTQLDFVKAVATMLGVFAVPVEGNNIIRFVSVDDVVAKIGQAYDWTKRVVASYKANKPMAMSFALEGFAQHNLLLYKHDDSVLGEYDGDIVCNVASLDKEKNMAELKFAASDMRGPLAYIRLYEYDKEGKRELKKVQPRILEEISIEGLSGGSFANLSFPKLIERFYGSYQKAVKTPRIIKEKIEIRDTDLQRLDVTTPVYLAQYGKYYAILSVTAEHTGIANVELLQLDI